jgi:hypothetical protein
MSNKSTSMRFSDDELKLLDAIGAIQHRNHGLRLSRSDVIRHLLKRATPSNDPDILHAEHRRIYKKVFGQQ